MRSTAFCIATLFVNFLTLVSPASGEIPWQKNLRDAHAKAQAEGKLLLLHFYGDNCVWCDRLEAGAFQSPAVKQAILQRYVPVKVHAGRNPKITSTFKVRKLPTDVIVTTDGRALEHRTSPQDPNLYIGMLSSVAAPMLVNESGSMPGPQVSAPPRVADARPGGGKAVPSYAGPGPAGNAGPGTGSAPPNTFASQQTVQNRPAAVSKPAASRRVPESAPVAPTGPRAVAVSPPGRSTPNPYVTNTQPANMQHPNMQPASVSGAEVASSPGLQVPASGMRTNRLVSSRREVASIGVPVAGGAPGRPNVGASHGPEASRPELALDGYCPVTVVTEDAWLEGNPEFGVVHLGKLYLFASGAKMQTFLADPAPYTPVLNEVDVVRFFEERVIVPGKRDFGVTDPVHKRIFLFADEAAMNHFMESYKRYTGPAIKLMDTAVREANVNRR